LVAGWSGRRHLRGRLSAIPIASASLDTALPLAISIALSVYTR
jgi:hypothetical protein